MKRNIFEISNGVYLIEDIKAVVIAVYVPEETSCGSCFFISRGIYDCRKLDCLSKIYVKVENIVFLEKEEEPE